MLGAFCSFLALPFFCPPVANWTQVADFSVFGVDVNNGTIWAIDAYGQVLCKQNDTWTLTNSSAAWSISAGSGGSAWYTNEKHQIFRWTGNSWEAVDGYASFVSAISMDEAVTVDESGEMYLYENGEWSQPVETTNATMVSVGAGGRGVWMVDMANTAHSFQHDGWKTEKEDVFYVDVQDTDKVVIRKASDASVELLRSGTWTTLDKRCLFVSIDEDVVYCIDVGDGKLYYISMNEI